MSVPKMSVVVIDRHGGLHETLGALRAQEPADAIEVVFVADDVDAARRAYPELAAFETVRVVEGGGAPTTAMAIAAGVRAARGAVIAYCEDHVLPEPGWVRARLDAHAAGAAVVGGTLRNANPDTVVSWAAFLQSFGPFAMPVAGGRSANLPWHQCSYRQKLLPLGPELEALLETEGLLHADLSKAGHTLVVEASAVAGHINVSRRGSYVLQAWLGGRVWGAGRAQHERWSRAQRLWNALLWPWSALVEVRLRLADVQRVVPSRRRSVGAALAAGIVVHALGEATGVLVGSGRATMLRADFELNRRAHLVAGDMPGR